MLIDIKESDDHIRNLQAKTISYLNKLGYSVDLRSKEYFSKRSIALDRRGFPFSIRGGTINFLHKVEFHKDSFISSLDITIFEYNTNSELGVDFIQRLRKVKSFLMKHTMLKPNTINRVKNIGDPISDDKEFMNYEGELYLTNTVQPNTCEYTEDNMEKYLFKVAKELPSLAKKVDGILKQRRKGRM